MKQKNKTAAARRQAPTTIKTKEKKCMVEYIAVNLFCLFVFLAFGYVAVMSFFQTSTIDPTKYVSEKILFQSDYIPLNFLVTFLIFLFIFAMRRFYDFFAKVNLRIMEIALAVFVITLGFIWIFNVRSIPAADSQNIFEAATDAAKDNYKSMQNHTAFYNSDFYNGYSYFHFYPFQLGFVFICELIYRVFGTDSSMPVQVINVLCVAATYYALARLSFLLFKKRSVEFITILLLAVCFQPILFCTFVYGNIIGMCCAVWASLLLVKYFQTGKWLWAAVSGVLLVLATLAKYNNMIYLAAFVIMLIIHIFRDKKWQSAAIAAAMVIAVLLSNSAVIGMYEQRSGTDFEDGVPQTMYLDMGLSESYMAPGWYSTSTEDPVTKRRLPVGKQAYLDYYLDPKLRGKQDVKISDANEKVRKHIDSRMEVFSDDPDYMMDFFSKKILSQWNEPTFESIWVSRVKQHTATEEQKTKFKSDVVNSEQMKGLTQSVYFKSTGQVLELHFNLYMQIVYAMFAAGIYLMFINKRTGIETVLLPLVLLGAFGYHLLFEGKSQYILSYIPLLIPTAAYAFSVMLGGKYEGVKKILAKINHIPNRYND